MIDFTHCCVCGHSHILFCLGVNSLAHVGFSLICILTGNIRTCNSKSFACALDFIGEQEKLFNYEGLTHYYIIVCTKSIRMSRDCPEMVKRYSLIRPECHMKLCPVQFHNSALVLTVLVP